jgi:hypothetical protein
MMNPVENAQNAWKFMMPADRYKTSSLGKGNWRTVIGLSGGVDSAAAAYQQLQETDDEIFVFHLRIKREASHISDYQFYAYLNVVHWLQLNCRPFTILPILTVEPPLVPNEDRPSISEGTGNVLDQEIVGVYGAWWAKQLLADWFVIGKNKSEDSGIKGRISAHLSETIFGVLTQSWPCSMIFKNRHTHHKRDFIHGGEIPKELVDLTVACRNPQVEYGHEPKIYWRMVPCGECFACGRKYEAGQPEKTMGPVMKTEELMRRMHNGTLYLTQNGEDT